MRALVHGGVPATVAESGVTVWVLRWHAIPEATAAAWWPVLSEDERARAARFHFDHHRREFAAIHGATRWLLGRAVGQPPEALRFAAGAWGKPALADAPGVQFNLSHTRGMALLAVGAKPLGVDVERIKPELDWRPLARRFFAPQEVAALEALPAEEQRRAFFCCWTRKEAYLKARGMGLSLPLDGFAVTVTGPARLLACAEGVADGTPWALRALDVGAEHVAAVAVAGAGVPVALRELPVALDAFVP